MRVLLLDFFLCIFLTYLFSFFLCGLFFIYFTLLRIFTIPAIQAFDNFILVCCVLFHYTLKKINSMRLLLKYFKHVCLLETFGDRAPLSTGNQAVAAGILGPNKCVPR